MVCNHNLQISVWPRLRNTMMRSSMSCSNSCKRMISNRFGLSSMTQTSKLKLKMALLHTMTKRISFQMVSMLSRVVRPRLFTAPSSLQIKPWTPSVRVLTSLVMKWRNCHRKPRMLLCKLSTLLERREKNSSPMSNSFSLSLIS